MPMTSSCTGLLLACILAGATPGAIAATPPDEIPFNYPPPPVEGAADYFTIAEAGEARACIVAPAQAAIEEIRAARTLRTYLGLVTGAKFGLHLEGADIPPGLAQIHVGETSRAKAVPLDLPPVRYGEDELPNVNGYLVKTVEPQTLVLRGATPQATVFAAVGLLRRYVGVRRYWPGEPGGIGDVVPERATLKLPEIEWRDWPYFVSRIMSGTDDRGPQSDLGKWARFKDFWRLYYTIPSNESYYRLLNTAQHLDEPELFPLIDGRRFVPKVEPGKRIPHGWQPCVSNPRVARIMVDSILEIFRNEPDRFATNIAVNDGLGDCGCDNCRAMDAPGADPINRIGLCDRYVRFDNRVAESVAEEFPDRILAFIAYGSMREPPTAVRLHPMLMPVLCVGGNAFEMWDKWEEMGARRMGIYLYHDDLWFIIPKLDIHQSAKRLRYIVESGRARHFYQEFYGIYPLDGMVGYVETELLWDPRLDEDELLAEYYDSFFRTAAAPMRSFYEALEEGYERWLADAGDPHPHGPDISSIRLSKSLDQFAVLPVETATRAQQHLDAALTAAGDDALVRDRVELVRTIFGFAVPGARLYWARERLAQASPDSPAAAERVIADAREAVDSGLALSAYKYAVMEKSPATEYANHGDRDTLYNDLQEGAVHSSVLSGIGRGFQATSDYLRRSLGPERAEAWWRGQRDEEARPVLAELISVAAFEAGGRELPNLIADPSFEERGLRRPADAPGELPAEHQLQGGLRLWHGAGTPMKCTLTDEEAHAGKYSVAIWDTQHAGLSEAVSAAAGDHLRMSVWVNHDDRQGSYQVAALPRSDRMLGRTTVPVPWKPGEWQQIEIAFTAPPETQTVGLYLFVDRQSPGARVWVDDFFVGKYPD